jgi:hypothetical protein
VAIVLPLRIQKDPRRPNTVEVRDANRTEIGLIHQRFGRWSNFPSDAVKAKTSVQLGPFPTMEAAFEAFRVALGGDATAS